jgi:hypothetical protein
MATRLAVLGVAAVGGLMAFGPAPVGAATSSAAIGTLHAVRCKPLASDPPLEAPQYALDEGAAGGADGWWCQLPHATQMPTKLVPMLRYVTPLPNQYAGYSTQYSTKQSATLSATQPTIIVSSDVNSAVRPGNVPHRAPAGGKKVELVKGVTAKLVVKGHDVQVSWAFPTKGVPQYLQAVTTVTVRGTDVPTSTVLAVAKHVAPD